MIKCTGTKKVTWKITDPKRWKSVKESITWTEGILVNFLNQQENYRSAYQYILKKVTSVHHSSITLIWKIYPSNEPKSQ